jgi:hypothetical protein
MAVKSNFAAGEVLTASNVNTFLTNGGLVYVGQANLSSTTTNVSSVFSSTFTSYRIVVVNGVVGANSSNITMALSGAGGSTYQTAGSYLALGTATVTAFAPAATTNSLVAIGDTEGYALSIDIHNPNAAKPTYWFSTFTGQRTSGQFGGRESTSTAHTGFSLNNANGFTGGTAFVYGYRIA